MNTEVQNAVERLNTVLPLEKREHEASVNGHKEHCMCVQNSLAVSIPRGNREIFRLPDLTDFTAVFFLPLITKQAA